MKRECSVDSKVRRGECNGHEWRVDDDRLKSSRCTIHNQGNAQNVFLAFDLYITTSMVVNALLAVC